MTYSQLAAKILPPNDDTLRQCLTVGGCPQEHLSAQINVWRQGAMRNLLDLYEVITTMPPTKKGNKTVVRALPADNESAWPSLVTQTLRAQFMECASDLYIPTRHASVVGFFAYRDEAWDFTVMPDYKGGLEILGRRGVKVRVPRHVYEEDEYEAYREFDGERELVKVSHKSARLNARGPIIGAYIMWTYNGITDFKEMDAAHFEKIRRFTDRVDDQGIAQKRGYRSGDFGEEGYLISLVHWLCKWARGAVEEDVLGPAPTLPPDDDADRRVKEALTQPPAPPPEPKPEGGDDPKPEGEGKQEVEHKPSRDWD